eukprot:160926-Chlamydomonas_euryale.AAC.1
MTKWSAAEAALKCNMYGLCVHSLVLALPCCMRGTSPDSHGWMDGWTGWLLTYGVRHSRIAEGDCPERGLQ